MTTILLFHSPGCPHCDRMIDIMDKPEVHRVTQDVRRIPSGQEPSMWEQYNIKSVPTMILPDGTPLVGNEAFDWLRSRLQERGLDEQALVNQNAETIPAQGGNKKLIFGGLLAIGALIFADRRGWLGFLGR